MIKHLKVISILLLIVVCQNIELKAADSTKIYSFKIHDEIGPSAWRITKIALEEAKRQESDVILLDLNTYGGRVDFADSIRSMILSFPIPIYVLIRNNAASAGALISIACDSIYMTPGSTIGAASVVNGEGELMPEKYQSYFRAKMRETAIESGRNPDIAEAMVDPKIVVEGIVDENTLITFGVEEALKNNYCEGRVKGSKQIFERLGLTHYKVVNYEISALEKLIHFLINPAVSGVLIMLIIGGVYMEIKTPGVGFPIIIAITAALMFFAPHYLNGLANNWEIALFIVGLILIAIEVFVIPGFGVFGILGILFTIAGLSFSLIGVMPSDSSIPLPDITRLGYALTLVLGSISFGLISSVFIGGKILSTDNAISSKIILSTNEADSKVLAETGLSYKTLIGKTGICVTPLMPGGKVKIDGVKFDAIAETGSIENQVEVKVVNFSHAQIVVKPL